MMPYVNPNYQAPSFFKNHKKLAISAIITVILLISLIITSAILHENAENRRLDAESVTLKKDLEIGYGEIAKVSDFIEQLNGTLVDDFTIDTSELGERTIDFRYINVKNRERLSHLTINIVDKTPPLIYGNKSYTLPRGYEGELTNLILSGDEIDDHPAREVKGEYNLNQVGRYQLEYVVTDASGNQSSHPFVLYINEPDAITTPTTKHDELPLAELIATHKTAQTKIGIDVSKWQGNIDWPTVKASGVEFALIRVGYQNHYDGEYILDPYFEANITAANQLNLPVGVYFYSYANNVKQAENQADWVKAQLNGHQAELGIVFDWENWSSFNAAGISFRTLHRITDTFIRSAQNSGYLGTVYGSKNYLEKIWGDLNHPVWLAQYNDHVTYNGQYWLWQLSDTGQVPGIASDVDLNVMYLENTPQL